jgi:hypothetical protein
MNRLTRSLAYPAVLGLAAVVVAAPFTPDGPKPSAPPAAPKPEAAGPAPPAAEKPVDPAAAIKITGAAVETKTAVTPKPLSPAVRKGLEYLVKRQQEDGGWNQGGGWRTAVNGQGGRVEGKQVEDPSDVGNTCFALLALFRAGSTPTAGEYKDAVARGLKFVLARVEKADKDSLYVTDVRNTQLQSKIGPYVDTFLANLVLAEMKGKAGPDEPRLAAALEKTMTKIVKHQTAEGGFAGNAGWAPTLSLGICNKGIARAKQNGVEVDQKVLDRALAQSKAAAAGTGAVAAAPPAAATGAVGKPAGEALAAAPPASTSGDRVAAFGAMRGAGGLGGAGGDAGVRLYSFGQGAGNSQDVVNSLRVDGAKAEQILKDSKASKEAKDKAAQTLETLKRAEADNYKVQEGLAEAVKDRQFVAGFGSNGGEEFLSFLNISEALLVKGGKDWQEWDAKMTQGLEKAQDKDGSWAGHHCITGKTFCTAAALLVLTADRTPFPADVLKASAEKKPDAPAPEKK